MGLHVCNYLPSDVTTALLADSPAVMLSFASFDEVSHNMESPTWWWGEAEGSLQSTASKELRLWSRPAHEELNPSLLSGSRSFLS